MTTVTRKIQALILSVVILTVAFPQTADTASFNWFDFIQKDIAVAKEEVKFPVSDDREPIRVKNVVATAYSSHVNQTDSTPFIPADGSDYKELFEKNGAVYAIASNDLPLGTQVRFPEVYGDTVFTVRDRMNARYTGKGRIDFYIIVGDEEGNLDLDKSLALAKQFGVKKMKMEIYPRVK